MKKIILGVFAFSLITFVACKKDIASPDAQATEQFTSDLTDDDYTYIDDSNSFDDEKEAVELETRATDPFSITSISASDTIVAADMDGCTTHKFKGLIKAKTATFTITGVGFGAAKGNSTIVAYSSKDTATKYTVTTGTWSATSVGFTLSGIPDTLKNFSMKVSFTNPAVRKDSTAASPAKFVSKTKNKTVKCIGINANSKIYGTSDWYLQKQLNTATIPTTAAIDTTTTGTHYVPVKGDILEKSGGKKGVILSITDGTGGFKKILIGQQNSLCTSIIKTGTWSYKLKFTPKSDEAAATTWTKFAH